MNRREQLLGLELRGARRRANLRLHEVAGALGVCVATIHNYESGKVVPDALRLIDLAGLLQVNLAALPLRVAGTPPRRRMAAPRRAAA